MDGGERAGDASKAYEGDMGVATPDTRELMPPIRRQVEDVARRDHSLKNFKVVENVEVHVCTRAPRERMAVREAPELLHMSRLDEHNFS
jgi:aspartate carbamoyltransferase catalytic subunit